MATERTQSSPPTSRRSLRPLVLLALAVITVIVASIAIRWTLRTRSLAWQVQRGLALLDATRGPEQVRAALDQWERGVHERRGTANDDLIDHLLNRCNLDDRRIQLLLSVLTGADYGDRRADWEHWLATRAALQTGTIPAPPRKEAVTLERRWSAAVGLTAWFTTIIPLDGQVYAASLGADFADPSDRADGVVRVDGATGASQLIFAAPPSHHGPRDMIGIAAGNDCLFAACHNGYVYCLSPTGELVWSAHAAAPIIGAPLSIDTNRDGVTDVVVVTAAGNVVAMSGRNGRTTWVATITAPSPEGVPLGATLAFGDVLSRGGDELIVTLPDGTVSVLGARDGHALWKHDFSAGTLTGTLCRLEPDQTGPPLVLADRAANVWSIVATNRALAPALLQNLNLHGSNSVIAGLRTLAGGPDTPALLIACPTGDYASRYGSVCALDAEGLQWRLPLGGAVWGTPAIADLNADGRSELVVASIEPDAQELVRGVVTIVSRDGRYLARAIVPAPVECSPIVTDLDGDGRLEVLIADQSGHLHCFATRGHGPVEWGLPAGDSHNTRNATYAYEYGQLAPSLQWNWQPGR